jgi:transcriptional regulator with XRE-family HTH domain
MAVTRKWEDIYRGLDALSTEDRDEIALKVEIVGEVLAARKDAGMTQDELEKLTGVKQSMIARLENNGMDPQLTTILKILRPLGKTLAVVPLSEKQEDVPMRQL